MVETVIRKSMSNVLEKLWDKLTDKIVETLMTGVMLAMTTILLFVDRGDVFGALGTLGSDADATKLGTLHIPTRMLEENGVSGELALIYRSVDLSDEEDLRLTVECKDGKFLPEDFLWGLRHADSVDGDTDRLAGDINRLTKNYWIPKIKDSNGARDQPIEIGPARLHVFAGPAGGRCQWRYLDKKIADMRNFSSQEISDVTLGLAFVLGLVLVTCVAAAMLVVQRLSTEPDGTPTPGEAADGS